MKKIMKIAVILLALLMVGSLFAQDYDDDAPAPRRRRGSNFLLRKNFSIGILGSVKLKTDILDSDDNVIQSIDAEEKKALFGISGRLYPFMDGKLGVGVSMIYLQTVEFDYYDQDEFIVDFNLLYRIRLGRKILINAGIGYSQYLTSYTYHNGTADDSEWGKGGYNLQIGGELFLSRDISASISWKWTHFTYDAVGDIGTDVNKDDTITKRYLTVDIGLHYWL